MRCISGGISGNYAILREAWLPFEFYLTNNPVILSDKFKPLRDNGIDLGISATVEPVFSSDLKVIADNVLRIAGFFPNQT